MRTSATLASGIWSGRAAARAGRLWWSSARCRTAHGRRRIGRHAGARGSDEQILDLLDSRSRIAGVADANRITLAILDGLRDGLAPQGDFDHVLHVADVHAIAGRLLAVDRDLQIALADDLIGHDGDGPGNATEHFGDVLRHRLDLIQVAAEHLDADHRPHAGGQHVDPVDDRLREDIAPAGHLNRAVHLLDEFVFRLLPEQQPAGEVLV